MPTELDTAIAAARQAGGLLLQNLGHVQVKHKSPMEIVTEIDLQSQALIASRLQNAFPEYGFIGEEGTAGEVSRENNWIVDPIDGTTNYSRGYPAFAISIALEKGGETVLGVVYNPVLDELFTAEKGGGATLNGSTIRVTGVRELSQALVASGFPYDAWTNAADNLENWGRLVKRAHSTRCDGVAALDLCHVAMGRLDAYWEIDLEPWDVAAGALIVQEAGGEVTAVSGELFTPYLRSVLASNGHLHPEMLNFLAPGR